jgi:lipoate-protein ligase A
MSSTWRLLITPPAPGRHNMAVDEAILDSVAGGQSPPTLRLYAWDPGCLSLGHAQSADVVDEEAVAEAGWDVVRRPTGGRALLHIDELTYSISAPVSLPGLSEGVLPSYRYLSGGLLAGLQHLGLRPDAPSLAVVGEDGLRNPICFEVPSAYEITVGGRKMIGSAQLRRRGALLQHGSLPLSGDITRVVRALSFPDESTRREAADRLRRHATTVEEALGRQVSFDAAGQAVVEGFANGLGWKVAAGELTEAEESLARQLEATLYRRGVPSPDYPRPSDGRIR